MLVSLAAISLPYFTTNLIAGGRYNLFLSRLRFFLRQHNIFDEGFEIREFFRYLHQFIFTYGHLMEIFLMLCHLLSLYLFFKIIYAFFFVLRRKKDLANYVRQDAPNMEYSDEDKPYRIQAHRHVAEYNGRKRILLMFSIGIPYWIIYILVWLVNIFS